MRQNVEGWSVFLLHGHIRPFAQLMPLPKPNLYRFPLLDKEP